MLKAPDKCSSNLARNRHQVSLPLALTPRSYRSTSSLPEAQPSPCCSLFVVRTNDSNPYFTVVPLHHPNRALAGVSKEGYLYSRTV